MTTTYCLIIAIAALIIWNLIQQIRIDTLSARIEEMSGPEITEKELDEEWNRIQGQLRFDDEQYGI